MIAWLRKHLCREGFWNGDASREIDRLIAENDALRERIAELEDLL